MLAISRASGKFIVGSNNRLGSINRAGSKNRASLNT